MNNYRKLNELFNQADKLYIYLNCNTIGKEFMKNAEDEGFRFADGKKPTKRKHADIMAVYKNKELCYVGYIGRINFKRDECDVPRIDYDKYITYQNNYFYKK